MACDKIQYLNYDRKRENVSSQLNGGDQHTYVCDHEICSNSVV